MPAICRERASVSRRSRGARPRTTGVKLAVTSSGEDLRRARDFSAAYERGIIVGVNGIQDGAYHTDIWVFPRLAGKGLWIVKQGAGSMGDGTDLKSCNEECEGAHGLYQESSCNVGSTTRVIIRTQFHTNLMIYILTLERANLC